MELLAGTDSIKQDLTFEFHVAVRLLGEDFVQTQICDVRRAKECVNVNKLGASACFGMHT